MLLKKVNSVLPLIFLISHPFNPPHVLINQLLSLLFHSNCFCGPMNSTNSIITWYSAILTMMTFRQHCLCLPSVTSCSWISFHLFWLFSYMLTPLCLSKLNSFRTSSGFSYNIASFFLNYTHTHTHTQRLIESICWWFSIYFCRTFFRASHSHIQISILNDL